MNELKTIITHTATLRIMWWSGVFGLLAYGSKCNKDIEIEKAKNFKNKCITCNIDKYNKTDECVFGDN